MKPIKRLTRSQKAIALALHGNKPDDFRHATYKQWLADVTSIEHSIKARTPSFNDLRFWYVAAYGEKRTNR